MLTSCSFKFYGFLFISLSSSKRFLYALSTDNICISPSEMHRQKTFGYCTEESNDAENRWHELINSRRFGGLCFVHEKTKRIMQIWSEYVEELGNVNVEAFHGHCETFLHSYHSIISSEGLSDEVFHLLVFFTKMRYLTPEQFTSLLKILHTKPVSVATFMFEFVLVR
ncbi:conserved hypothetical protein [Trichinella spiralis]|uniref:hypothetical protein n=1 Tax=Trichinella spiralis TaxID=6334 RepID=UPI0001EFC8E6|nr:conserved hypothetical protein [Trichinella spiralis]